MQNLTTKTVGTLVSTVAFHASNLIASIGIDAITAHNTSSSMSDLQTPDNTPSPTDLYWMQVTKKMEEMANKHGAKFIGGFTNSKGELFVSSNMDPNDPHYQLPENLR